MSRSVPKTAHSWSFGSNQGQEPSQGFRFLLKTAHFCLKTASFRSKQSQEPSQGSRSLLKTAHFC